MVSAVNTKAVFLDDIFNLSGLILHPKSLVLNVTVLMIHLDRRIQVDLPTLRQRHLRLADAKCLVPAPAGSFAILCQVHSLMIYRLIHPIRWIIRCLDASRAHGHQILVRLVIAKDVELAAYRRIFREPDLGRSKLVDLAADWTQIEKVFHELRDRLLAHKRKNKS